MRGRNWSALTLAAAVALAGCQSSRSSRKVALAEPPLADSGAGGVVVGAGADGTAVAALPPERQASFADRHPLFSKPKAYYDTTGGGKLGKTAAATIIGVPAGIVGEIRQIVAGRPQAQDPAVVAPSAVVTPGSLTPE